MKSWCWRCWNFNSLRQSVSSMSFVVAGNMWRAVGLMELHSRSLRPAEMRSLGWHPRQTSAWTGIDCHLSCRSRHHLASIRCPSPPADRFLVGSGPSEAEKGLLHFPLGFPFGLWRDILESFRFGLAFWRLGHFRLNFALAFHFLFDFLDSASLPHPHRQPWVTLGSLYLGLQVPHPIVNAS